MGSSSIAVNQPLMFEEEEPLVQNEVKNEIYKF